MIKLKNVNKYYPIGFDAFHALKNIDLNIGKGELVSIEGPSGAGKSTLLHILGLLDGFDDGEYTLDGKDMKGLRDGKASKLRNSRIGFVMQDFSLINQKSVLFNVMLPLMFSPVSFSKIKSKAINALRQVGIADQAEKRVNQLSGGQRQRVAIARAIITNPSLILADEPTGALDSTTSHQIMELLTNIKKSGDTTVIIVTHNPLVSEYCERRIFMLDGEIVTDKIGVV